MLQYNWDIITKKAAVLDYIVEITVKSIEICTLYVLRLFHFTLLSTHASLRQLNPLLHELAIFDILKNVRLIYTPYSGL